MKSEDTKFGLERRRWLQSMTALTAGSLLLTRPIPVLATVNEKRSLSFHHTHTNEKLAIDYFSGKGYIPDALKQINAFLRDFRTGEEYPIDTQLLDMLFKIQQMTASRGQFEVISGYRSPATNAMLRGNSNSVAKRSLHMQGRAIDIRLSDTSSEAIRKSAIDLGSGGVGYYARSNFVHLDTGRFRSW